MDSKSAVKSRIPISTRKKEQTSDATTPKLNIKEPSKALETKNNTVTLKTTRSEVNVKTKTSGEMQISKRNVDKATFSEKAACALKNWKPKTLNENMSPKEIETLSKGKVNLMETPKIREFNKFKKTSSKLGKTGVNLVSKRVAGASNLHITNAREETKKDPRSMTAPKKITTANTLCRDSKLRRSRTEHEINLGKAGSSSSRPSLKLGSREKTQNENKEKEIVKSSVLPRNETCTTLEENALPKETSAESIKPLARSGSIRVPKTLPLERKATKPIESRLKPLRRSKTFHVFDLVPVLQLKATISTDKMDLVSEEGPDIECDNQQKHLLSEKDLEKASVTPKRQIPHGGIFFKMHCAKKVQVAVFNTQSEK